MLHFFDVCHERLAALQLSKHANNDVTILLHGVTHSLYLWQADPFYTQWSNCWALSLPGHFPALCSAQPPFAVDVPTMIEPLAAAIRQIADGHEVTLLGISMGAFAALGLAASHPELVRRVISISGFAKGRWIGSYGILQALARGGTPGRMLFRALSRLAGKSSLVVQLSCL
jgi:pimeloyl-ACP methyl ester carboxylesterase